MSNCPLNRPTAHPLLSAGDPGQRGPACAHPKPGRPVGVLCVVSLIHEQRRRALGRCEVHNAALCGTRVERRRPALAHDPMPPPCSQQFELAALPGTSEEDMRTALHFVVVGGGPTGARLPPSRVFSSPLPCTLHLQPRLGRCVPALHALVPPCPPPTAQAWSLRAHSATSCGTT